LLTLTVFFYYNQPAGELDICSCKLPSQNDRLYRVTHKSVKHFKNSPQIDYATDHGNSYVDRERNC